MTTTLNVENIATDADLSAVPGSGALVTRAMPVQSARDAIRASALQDVVDALASRSPPVADTDLTYPAELKNAVVYRSLHVIFRSARTGAGDHWDLLAKDYEREYRTAVGRSYTVSSNQSSPGGFSFSMERR